MFSERLHSVPVSGGVK